MSKINKARLKYGGKAPNCNEITPSPDKTPPASEREARFGHGFFMQMFVILEANRSDHLGHINK